MKRLGALRRSFTWPFPAASHRAALRVVTALLLSGVQLRCASPASADVTDATWTNDIANDLGGPDSDALDSGIPWGPDAASDAASSTDADACARTRPEWGRGGEFMLPGGDCLSCHAVGRPATRHPFTVAGTVFIGEVCPVGLSGATVTVEDAEGRRVTLRTNEVGNFFASVPLTQPFHFAVEFMGRRREMPRLAESGSCGSCHGPGHDRPYVSP